MSLAGVGEVSADVLSTPVGVVDHASDLAAAGGDRGVDSVDDQGGAHVGVDRPADQSSGGYVDDRGQIEPAGADA